MNSCANSNSKLASKDTAALITNGALALSELRNVLQHALGAHAPGQAA